MSPRRTARHDDGTADPLVALARADPLSPFYDPRYARPLSSTPPDGWGEIDMALLEETRAAVPAFPVDLLPTFWRDWVLDTANATGAPADYVAQSLFAAVAGLCGAGVVVRLGPRWDEPLVLWQALVGPPSSGKSPAMAPMRELLAGSMPNGTTMRRARLSPRRRSARSPTPSRPIRAASCCGATIRRRGCTPMPCARRGCRPGRRRRCRSGKARASAASTASP